MKQMIVQGVATFDIEMTVFVPEDGTPEDGLVAAVKRLRSEGASLEEATFAYIPFGTALYVGGYVDGEPADPVVVEWTPALDSKAEERGESDGNSSKAI
jgi:hypothetical protein